MRPLPPSDSVFARMLARVEQENRASRQWVTAVRRPVDTHHYRLAADAANRASTLIGFLEDEAAAVGVEINRLAQIDERIEVIREWIGPGTPKQPVESKR